MNDRCLDKDFAVYTVSYCEHRVDETGEDFVTPDLDEF
jgi:hypothetical protein